MEKASLPGRTELCMRGSLRRIGSLARGSIIGQINLGILVTSKMDSVMEKENTKAKKTASSTKETGLKECVTAKVSSNTNLGTSHSTSLF